MDAGKVKVVLNALREELQSRRSTAAEAGSASDDAPIAPHGDAGADRDTDHGGERHRSRQRVAAEADGVLVDLSSEARASAFALEGPEESVPAAEFSQRPIPELVVPFFVPDEPFVVIAPYLVKAVLAAAVAGILMLFFL